MQDVIFKDAMIYKKYGLQYVIEHFKNKYKNTYRKRMIQGINSYNELLKLLDNICDNKNWLYLTRKNNDINYYVFFDINYNLAIDINYQIDTNNLLNELFNNKSENINDEYINELFNNCNMYIIEENIINKHVINHIMKKDYVKLKYHTAINYIIESGNTENPKEYYKNILKLNYLTDI